MLSPFGEHNNMNLEVYHLYVVELGYSQSETSVCIISNWFPSLGIPLVCPWSSFQQLSAKSGCGL